MKARQLFEKELRNKLALKSSGKTSEEALIIKAFKYFDLDNSGECSKDEFLKAIAKLGVTGFPNKQLLEIFETYDTNKNGELDYKEFASCLYGEEDEDEEDNSNKNEKNNNNTKGKNEDIGISEEAQAKLKNSKVMDKFRTVILKRGGTGILGLARQFKIFDDNNSKTLDLTEVTKAIRDFQVDLSPNEIKILFNILDEQGSGEISYDVFLREIRGDMNSKRRSLVNQAFSKLDKDKSGSIEFEEISSLYNCKKHPEVLAGKKTEKEVFLDFMKTFQLHSEIKGKGKVDDIISREEFQEYYENISASIDRDDYFELMMTNCWKLGKAETYEGQKAWTNKDENTTVNKSAGKGFNSLNNKGNKTSPFATDDKIGFGGNAKNTTEIPSDGTPLEKFKAAIARRGIRGIMSIRRSFMIADDNNDKTIDLKEFTKLCRDYRIPLDEKEAKSLFKTFDNDKSGSIDYDEFVRAVTDRMNKRRIAIVKKAFAILDKNGNGLVELDDIRGTYNASKHPDVKSGKKTEDEVLGEFLDVFEYHFNLLNDNKSKDRSITFEEFTEYYENISMSVENDDYFDLILNNAWNLDGSRVTKKGWKGDDDVFGQKKK